MRRRVFVGGELGMGFLSLFTGGKRKKRRKRKGPPPDRPRAPRSAVARALRHVAAASGSPLAAEIGQRIATAFSTIETAVLAIDAVCDKLGEARDLVSAAQATSDAGRRALFAGRYDDVRAEIDALVGSASHNRVNLINGRLIGGRSPAFDIALDERGRASIAVQIANLTTGPGGLALSPPRSAFAEDAELATIAAEIVAAQALAASVSARFADHAALLSERLQRLQSAAGSRVIEAELPTGADAMPPAEEELGPVDLSIAEVEERLHKLADRLAERAAQAETQPAG